MKKCTLMLTIFAMALSSMPAFGATDAEIRALKAQMREMQRKIQKLEQGSTEHVNQAAVNDMVEKAISKEGVPEWLSKIFGFEGEVSYKYKKINDKQADTDDQSNELKGLLTIYGKVNDETDLVMRFRADTVQGNDDKNVDMELLYVDYHPQSIDRLPFIGTGIDMLAGVTPFYEPGLVEGAHVLGGIIPYPFYHPVNVNIAFDGPELDGFSGIFKKDLGDNVELFTTAGGFWINKNADTTSVDTSLWGGQAGLTYMVPGLDDTYATMAVGYFDYGNAEGVLSGSSNTNDGAKLANDFDLIVANGEINFPLNKDLPILSDYPVTIFGEFANNTAATTDGDTAYCFGLSVGEIAAVGMWQFVYNYKDIEKDAALDIHNEGFGKTTDVTGHTFELGYRLAENISLTAGYLAGKQNVSTDKENYDELTLNVGFAF